jgi:NAD(P)H-dependent FMN reductase
MIRLIVLDGSLRPNGNTARALDAACAQLETHAFVDRIVLSGYSGTVYEIADRLRRADGFLVGTGTYWSSWGSPIQCFLELMTSYEATDVFVGKPSSVLVTMDATGGSEVAARLAATFVCLGCFAPPFGWMALSRIGVELGALRPAAVSDVWTHADIAVLIENLVVAARAPRLPYRAWSIDRAVPLDRPWPPTSPLDPAAPDF